MLQYFANTLHILSSEEDIPMRGAFMLGLTMGTITVAMMKTPLAKKMVKHMLSGN